MDSRGAGVPPAGWMESGKQAKRPMFSVVSHPAARLEAAPPEVTRCSFRRSCATSGGAASCRAMADGERENGSRQVRQVRQVCGRRAGGKNSRGGAETRRNGRTLLHKRTKRKRNGSAGVREKANIENHENRSADMERGRGSGCAVGARAPRPRSVRKAGNKRNDSLPTPEKGGAGGRESPGRVLMVWTARAGRQRRSLRKSPRGSSWSPCAGKNRLPPGFV